MTPKASLISRRQFAKTGAAAGVGIAAGLASPAIWAQSPAKPVKILLSAFPPDPAFHFYYYALENDFYKQEGLDVKIDAIPVETNAVRATAAGDADATCPGAASTIKVIGSGAKLKVAGNFWGADYFIVAKNDIQDLKGLEGRTVAVSAPGAAVHTYSVIMMQKRGVDPTKVQWVGAGSAASRFQALLGGRVDAAIISSTFASQAMGRGGYRIVADTAEDLPDWCWTLDVVSDDLLTRRPEAAQGLVTAYSRAVRWMYQHPDDAALISQKLLPDVPKDALTATVHRLVDKKIVRQTGDVRASAFNGIVDWLKGQGEIEKSIAYQDAVASNLAQVALEKLGPPSL